ncbi:MAG: VanZ family protein [candidate division Zixibacteria bacterium]|nr:VanZ family protein [candidate division Zixibacteria bacterium]
MRKFFLYYLPFILYAGLIFWVSSLSQLPDPHIKFDFIDKFAHAVEYAIFAVLILRIFMISGPKSTKTAYLSAILISILYAVSDEYHQSFVPGRFSDIFDVIADAVGTLCGTCTYYLFTRHKNRSSES